MNMNMNKLIILALAVVMALCIFTLNYYCIGMPFLDAWVITFVITALGAVIAALPDDTQGGRR